MTWTKLNDANSRLTMGRRKKYHSEEERKDVNGSADGTLRTK